MSELVTADVLAEPPATIYIGTQSRFAKGAGPVWPYQLAWIRALLRMHGSTKHHTCQ